MAAAVSPADRGLTRAPKRPPSRTSGVPPTAASGSILVLVHCLSLAARSSVSLTGREATTTRIAVMQQRFSGINRPRSLTFASGRAEWPRPENQLGRSKFGSARPLDPVVSGLFTRSDRVVWRYSRGFAAGAIIFNDPSAPSLFNAKSSGRLARRSAARSCARGSIGGHGSIAHQRSVRARESSDLRGRRRRGQRPLGAQLEHDRQPPVHGTRRRRPRARRACPGRRGLRPEAALRPGKALVLLARP